MVQGALFTAFVAAPRPAPAPTVPHATTAALSRLAANSLADAACTFSRGLRGKGGHLGIFFWGHLCHFFWGRLCLFYCPEATVSNERPLGRTYAFTSAYT